VVRRSQIRSRNRRQRSRGGWDVAVWKFDVSEGGNENIEEDQGDVNKEDDQLTVIVAVQTAFPSHSPLVFIMIHSARTFNCAKAANQAAYWEPR
jgi:hypothetical protein